jgi:Tfp pilus assembly protein PilO
MNWQSVGTTKVLGAVGLVLVAAAGWLVVLQPQTTELSGIRTQIDSTRSQNETSRVQVRKLEEQAKKLAGTRATAQELAARFPATADQPGLFRAVTAAALQAGIPARQVTELTPQAPVAGASAGAQLPGTQPSGSTPKGELASQTVAITVEGNYDQLQRLLENLEDTPRSYLISSVVLGAGATPGAFTAAITGLMFMMPAAVDPSVAPRR